MASEPEGPVERVIGRYALYDEIASGGMATVHFGRMVGAVGFARTVAIKRLHAQFARDQDFVEMFLDEARLAARIQHPNVVSTLDVLSLDGELFIVMEYIKGETLSRLLRAAKKAGEAAPPKLVANVVVGMLHGLHAAHEATDEKGGELAIVHRDVSPQNVIVGVDGVARLLDFGVAKAAGRLSSTREGQLKGKFAYMSPEQVQGGLIDRRTDVYAAAAVLWEGLVGRRLIDGDNEATLLQRVLTEEFVPPSKIRPDISKALDAVVMKGLDRDLTKRFATAREMSNALEDAIAIGSQREVGEWVERAAGSMLAIRAERVRELESRASGRADVGDMPVSALSVVTANRRRAAAAAPSTGPEEEAPTTFFDSKSGNPRTGSSSGFTAAASTAVPAPSPNQTGGKTIVLAAVGSAVLALSAAAIGAWLFAPRVVVDKPAPPAATTSARPDGTTEPAASATASAHVEPPVPVVSADPTPSATEPPPATTSKKSTAGKTAAPPDPRTPKPPAKTDCDPPYTIDAAGIRRVKPQCFLTGASLLFARTGASQHHLRERSSLSKIANAVRAPLFFASIALLTFAAAAQTPARGTPNDKKPGDPKDDKAACFTSYEQSQQLRKDGKLRASKTQMAVCSREICPKALRADCQKWLDEVQSTIPSVVIEGIAGNGVDTTSIRVTIDGTVAAEQLDGRAMEIDPGPHVFRYELGVQTKEERIVILEGDRNRKIRVSFAAATQPTTAPSQTAAPLATAAPPAAATSRPIPIVTYVTAGTTLIGAGIFAIFALSGKSKESSLNSSCTPNCTTSQVDSLKKTFLIGDIGLAVGVVSLGIATTTFFLRKPVVDQGVSFDVSPVHGGAVLQLGGAL